MKTLLSSILLLGSLSSFAACPDLTGEYAKCNSDILGPGLQSVEIISVMQNGKYTIDAVTDGESNGELTIGTNVLPGVDIDISCNSKTVFITISDNEETDYSQKMGVSLNKDGDLIHSLYYDVGTSNEGSIDYVCPRK
jgi:hypothetical protein